MSTPDQTASSPTLRDQLDVLRRYRTMIAIFVIVTPLVAYVWSSRQEPVFQGVAEVLVDRQNLGAELTGVAPANPFTDPERTTRTAALLARVDEVASRAIAIARLDLTPSELLEDTWVEARPNTDILEFGARRPTSSGADRLATAYADAYVAYDLENGAARLRAARAEIEARRAALARQGRQDTQAYVDLSRKAQDLRTLELLQPKLTVVQPSRDAPQVAPSTLRNVILAMLLGAIIGIALAFLRSALDRSIRHESEIEAVLGLPMLGRLSDPRAGLRTSDRIAVIDAPTTTAASEARLLRTTIELANLDRTASTLIVTSAAPSEGKTTTMANLGAALAEAGHEVALVDLDLRRPSLGSLFGLDNGVGLMNVLLGQFPLNHALTLVQGEPLRDGTSRKLGPAGSLNVLPAGVPPANPNEVIGSNALTELLKTLAGEHDYVLIDTPPVLAFGDAVSLSPRADGLVLVVDRRSADRRVLQETARALGRVPSHMLGFVLTGTEPQPTAYTSYYTPSAKEQPVPAAAPSTRRGPRPVRADDPAPTLLGGDGRPAPSPRRKSGRA